MRRASDKKIGFIGLGLMGKPIATNILKANFPLVVYDIRDGPLVEMASLGAKVAKSAKQVGDESNTVILMVADYPQIKEAASPPEGALGGMKRGSTLIVMSTISPTEVREMAEVAKQSGVATLDAPVSGGTEGAQQGTLTIMVGGDAETVSDNEYLFKAIGRNIYHVGEVGMGQAVKMINQLLVTVNLVTVAEALVMAKKLSIDLKVLSDIISQSAGDSWAFRHFAPRMIAGDFKARGALNIASKDLAMVVNVAMEHGIPLLVSSTAHQIYRVAQSRGLSSQDCTVLVKVLEEFAGVRVCD